MQQLMKFGRHAVAACATPESTDSNEMQTSNGLVAGFSQGTDFHRDTAALAEQVVPQHNYRLDAAALEGHHYGEVSCRDFRQSVLQAMPHRCDGPGCCKIERGAHRQCQGVLGGIKSSACVSEQLSVRVAAAKVMPPTTGCHLSAAVVPLLRPKPCGLQVDAARRHRAGARALPPPQARQRRKKAPARHIAWCALHR